MDKACNAFKEAYPEAPIGCCPSCHADEDYGFDFYDYEIGGNTYFLCCDLSNWARKAGLLARD